MTSREFSIKWSLRKFKGSYQEAFELLVEMIGDLHSTVADLEAKVNEMSKK